MKYFLALLFFLYPLTGISEARPRVQIKRNHVRPLPKQRNFNRQYYRNYRYRQYRYNRRHNWYRNRILHPYFRFYYYYNFRNPC